MDGFQYRNGDSNYCKDCYQYESGICCYDEKPVEAMKVCGLFIKKRLTTEKDGYTLKE